MQAYEAKVTEKMQGVAQTNLEEGQAFLEKNKKDPEVVTLASGLQYKALKRGDGPSPTATDKSDRFNDKGTYINGKVFDATAEGGDPVSFRVDQVIPGWQSAAPDEGRPQVGTLRPLEPGLRPAGFSAHRPQRHADFPNRTAGHQPGAVKHRSSVHEAQRR